MIMKLRKTILAATTAIPIIAAPLAAATAEDVRDKGTQKNVTFGKFQPTEYSLKGKPNIIVIVVDDLGYGQLNYDDTAYDKASLAKRVIPKRYQTNIDSAIEAARKSTPILRNLQDNGVMLRQGFVSHAMSGPSRAAIMTGRDPSRFGIYSNDDAELGVPITETFLPELFRNYGYNTAAIGKWHMSQITNRPVPENKKTRDYHDNFTTFSAEPFQPLNRGFNYFFGYHNSGVAYYNSPSLFRNRENIPAKGYVTEQLTDEALQVIKESKDRPFLMYLAYPAVHIPLEKMAPKKYQLFNTGNKDVDNYYATLNAVDQNVGRVLDQLKNDGKLENTLIFFLSDNGAVIDSPLPMNGRFRANKGQTFSGGVHVPMFVYWKGHLQKGQVYDKMVSSTDIFPTALAAANIPVPKPLSEKLDGVNLLPYLAAKNSEEPHKFLYWAQPRAFHFDEINTEFWFNYDEYVAGRSNDYPNNPYREEFSDFSWTIRSKDWTLHYYTKDKSYLLYKASDISEENDVSAANPTVVTKLRGEFAKWFAKSVVPQTGNNLPKYEQIFESLK